MEYRMKKNMGEVKCRRNKYWGFHRPELLKNISKLGPHASMPLDISLRICIFKKKPQPRQP